MILFFDSETTGLPEKDQNWETDYDAFPHIVQLAWIMTDDTGDMIYSKECHIIKPTDWDIPPEAEKIHKINTQLALDTGISDKVLLKAFFYEARKCDIIVGHNIYFDTAIIKAKALSLDFNKEEICEILHKDKRYDTMQKGMSMFSPKKWATLSELYQRLFNEELKNAHTALGDVEAVKRIYFNLINQ